MRHLFVHGDLDIEHLFYHRHYVDKLCSLKIAGQTLAEG